MVPADEEAWPLAEVPSELGAVVPPVLPRHNWPLHLPLLRHPHTAGRRDPLLRRRGLREEVEGSSTEVRRAVPAHRRVLVLGLCRRLRLLDDMAKSPVPPCLRGRAHHQRPHVRGGLQGVPSELLLLHGGAGLLRPALRHRGHHRLHRGGGQPLAVQDKVCAGVHGRPHRRHPEHPHAAGRGGGAPDAVCPVAVALLQEDDAGAVRLGWLHQAREHLPALEGRGDRQQLVWAL
mmetsp:Transcript_18243/g.57396  ORF Transcript_18243/g.57396 Transcript_18243/m.57396 type:complete len:233 (-) Transcript_18243:523-1221(-)